MSLCTTYVKSADGKWYAEPSLRGTTQDGKQWYLCFDEDDPPELVVQTDGDGKEIDAAKILRDAGLSFGGVRFDGVCGRMIGRAASFWVTITAPIPTPTKFDAVYDQQPQRQGTYYSFEPRRRKRGAR